jgi:hypothetical protein
MKKLQLTNSFHGTEMTVLAPDNWDEREYWLQVQAYAYGLPFGPERTKARNRMNKIRRTLCGSRSCTCGVIPVSLFRAKTGKIKNRRENV